MSSFLWISYGFLGQKPKNFWLCSIASTPGNLRGKLIPRLCNMELQASKHRFSPYANHSDVFRAQVMWRKEKMLTSFFIKIELR